MSLFWLYKKTMTLGKPIIRSVLASRLKAGKEDPSRIGERSGVPSRARPSGPLMWVHVASVGESLSMLPVIRLFLDQNPSAHVLMTTVTRTAADLMESRLPARAFHQYLPVDRPKWVRRFLDHWAPDIALWAESELWPFLMAEIAKRRLPAALLNARMSPSSFRNWSRAPALAEKILSCFTVILAQTEQDKDSFTRLGGRSVVVSDNIKYCAPPLPYDAAELDALRAAVGTRPVWLYASTHQGEEELALSAHRALSAHMPDLLTLIAPRHPERGPEIARFIKEDAPDIPVSLRSDDSLPASSCGIFVIDRLGELGLFYRLAPIVCMGRSFSDDGGGGHNPLEPALLDCAILHGPHVQNQQQIFDDMARAGACLPLDRKPELAPALQSLLSDPSRCAAFQEKARDFAHRKANVLEHVVVELEPVFLLAHLPILHLPCIEDGGSTA